MWRWCSTGSLERSLWGSQPLVTTTIVGWLRAFQNLKCTVTVLLLGCKKGIPRTSVLTHWQPLQTTLSKFALGDILLTKSITVSIYHCWIFQGLPDRNADFYLKESPDGTVCFESVTCPGAFVGIPTEKNSPCVINFTVNLMVRRCRLYNIYMWHCRWYYSAFLHFFQSIHKYGKKEVHEA